MLNIDVLDKHPDFSTTAMTMQTVAGTTYDLSNYPSITMDALASHSVSALSITLTTVTFQPSLADSYSSDIQFMTALQAKLGYVENTSAQVDVVPT